VAKFCALQSLRGTLAANDTCRSNRRVFKILGIGVGWILATLIVVIIVIVIMIIVMVLILEKSTAFPSFALAKVKQASRKSIFIFSPVGC